MEGINSKETIKQMKEDLVKKFIEDKVSSEEFTEKQKGLISGWLNEALNLGCVIGEKEGFVNSNPEALDKVVGMFTSLFDKNNTSDLAKSLICKFQLIIRNQCNVIEWYESIVKDMVDNNSNLKSEIDVIGICNGVD